MAIYTSLRFQHNQLNTFRVVLAFTISYYLPWTVAVAVLQQRIAGTAGRLEDFHRVRKRLMHMHKGLKSGLHHSEKRFSPESVAQRLAAPFFMPDATAYPELRTVAQQAKVDAVASAKAEAESAARAKADAARPGERYCCASLR